MTKLSRQLAMFRLISREAVRVYISTVCAYWANVSVTNTALQTCISNMKGIVFGKFHHQRKSKLYLMQNICRHNCPCGYNMWLPLRTFIVLWKQMIQYDKIMWDVHYSVFVYAQLKIATLSPDDLIKITTFFFFFFNVF